MFVIEKIDDKFLDEVSKPEKWIDRDPAYADRFSALAELRDCDRYTGGTLTGKNGWKRVASIVGPVLDVGRVLHDDFLHNKKRFYAWLDRNPHFCTYDRRRGRLR